ncbi:hypothetical protein CPB86DRAFT_825285 [Serendipita vermifera]|nr:hypothetical protein CPB86DRAFT_825285 [Serendipita vermifera]
MRLFARRSDRGNAATSNEHAADEADMRQPLLNRQVSAHSYASTTSPVRPTTGSTGHGRSRSKRRRTRIRSSVYADPPSSYRRALVLYTLAVTLSSAIFLCLFGVLKIVAWPHALHPSPLREFLLAAGAWTVAFALRIPILYISTLCNTFVNRFTIILSTFIQVFTQEALRLAILILIQIHLEPPQKQNGHYINLGDPSGVDLDWAPLPDVWDQAFTQVWWMALGWATADVAVGIVQGYEQLSLYRDVLAREQSHAQSSPSPPRHKRARSSRPPFDEVATRSASNLHLPSGGVPELERMSTAAIVEQPVTFSATPQRILPAEYVGEEGVVIVAHPRDLEAELSHMITRKQRAELEEVYGSPLPRIPIFLIALQRLDSIILSIGLTLLISSAYLRALYLPAITSPDNPSIPIGYAEEWAVDWRRIKDTTIPVFAAVDLVHFSLSILWIEALPKIGVHTASYVGLLVSLATFFAGLGSWGALV